MACSVQEDRADGLVTVLVDGEPSVEEIQSAMATIWTTPTYLENLRVLWDLRKGSLGHLDTQALRDVAQFEQNKRPDLATSRIALLVGRDVDFGLSRMLGAFMSEEPLEDRVFRDVEAAKAWLSE
jgi:hypothetical protein